MTQRHGGIIGIDHDGAKETITTFTSDGIFTPHTTQDVSFLCVGGGGCGAGADAGSGGGGAGGFRSSWNNEVSGGGASAEAALPLTKGTSYPIKVGDGGIGGGEDQHQYGRNPIRILSGTSRGFGDGHPSSIGGVSDSYTKLILSSGGHAGSTTFTDSSSGKSMAVSGDTHYETDQKKFGNSSIHFDGTGDYLTFNPGTDLNIGTGDFTCEAWVYHTGGNDDTIISDVDGWTFTYGNGGDLRFYTATGENLVDANTNFISNQWVHVAVVRASGTLAFYQNGTQVGTHSYTHDIADNSSATLIGKYHSGTSQYWTGYMDEIRVSIGIARYTGSFTVPTAVFSTDTHTKLLIHSSDEDGSNTFTDLSWNGYTITAVGDVHHKEDQFKNHGTAIYFDGTGDYLQLPTSSDWAMGTGDFTIECWFRQDASPSGKQAIFDTRVSGRDTTTGFSFGIHNNGSFYIYNNGDIPVTSAGFVSADTWHHAAVSRKSGTFVLYLDGVAKQYSTPTERDFTDTEAKIGRRNDTDAELFKGYLDELRVSKGIARYTGSTTTVQYFIPPYNTHNSVTSHGGGRAGSQDSGRAAGWGGGSGGGGSYTSIGGTRVCVGQGYAGGAAKHFGGSGYGGGGGGGASAVGAASTGTNSGGAGDVGGDGGAGRASTITGSSVTYAGGGGGGHRLAQTNAAEPGDGGAGGGGNGNGGGTHGTDGTGGLHGNGADGTANTGGGGGGSGATGASQYGRINDEGGDGGSGIVIMREPAASGVYNMDDVFRYVSDGKW